MEWHRAMWRYRTVGWRGGEALSCNVLESSGNAWAKQSPVALRNCYVWKCYEPLSCTKFCCVRHWRSTELVSNVTAMLCFLKAQLSLALFRQGNAPLRQSPESYAKALNRPSG